MKVSDYKIGFIGFGHMAQILFQAIDRAKLLSHSQIFFIDKDPAKMKEAEQKYKITSSSLETLVKSSDLLLICVRPNQVESLVKDLSRIGVEKKMVISIAAGIKSTFFHKYLGANLQFLRVMPNLASSVGEGMSLFSFSGHPSMEFRSLVNFLFSAAGEIVELSESLMDIGCGMAGSSPGLIFRLIEAQARVGEKEGISYAKSLKIAAQSFLGAAKMVLKGKHPEELIEQIATPGGTTAAGLKVMHESHIETLFQEAILASAKKSKEISEEYF